MLKCVRGDFLSHLMVKHSVGVPWSVCTIKEAFVVHTLRAIRVMLDQWLTRARRPTAPRSPQVPWEQVEAARVGLPWTSPKLLGLRGGDVELHDLEHVSVKCESAAVDSSLGPRV